MRTLIDLERVKTGRLRLRVRRETPVGAVDLVSSVEGDLDSVRDIARQALGHWAFVDEVVAMGVKAKARRR
jgi:hypothetical protein